MSELDRLKIELTNAITASLAKNQKASLVLAADHAVAFARTGDESSKRQFELLEARAQGYEWGIEVAQNVCREFKFNETK